MERTSKRTDLALEVRELIHESAPDTSEIEGVEAREYRRYGCPVTHVKILNEQGAEALGKPIGQYVTIEIFGLLRREQNSFQNAVRAIADELSALLPVDGIYSVLLAGLGNRDITPDAIGPLVMQSCIVTRHLVDKLPHEFGHMRPVAAITPGVLGTTGMESAEVIKGAVEHIRPGAVVIVDALTARRLSRLCCTVQLSDSGIVPGSGVGNARAALNRETIGVPVISLGVPTVVDAITLMADLGEQAGQEAMDWDEVSKFSGGLMVTPKEIDSQVAEISKVLGYGVNMSLHPELSFDDVAAFLS